MKAGFGQERKILAETFRTTREMIGLAQPTYARLFEVERTLVQELEEGQLPAALDQRLLKFLLISITLQKKPEFITALVQEMNNFYGLDHIFTQPSPLIALFEQVLSLDLERWPWIIDSVRFRCRAIKKGRLGSFLVLWSEHDMAHGLLLKALIRQTQAYINIIGGHALLLVPSIYLFLDLDLSRSNNPLVKEIESKLEKREPIGLALPRQLPKTANIDELELEQMRLFAFSQDIGVLKEAALK